MAALHSNRWVYGVLTLCLLVVYGGGFELCHGTDGSFDVKLGQCDKGACGPLADPGGSSGRDCDACVDVPLDSLPRAKSSTKHRLPTSSAVFVGSVPAICSAPAGQALSSRTLSNSVSPIELRTVILII